MCYKDFLRYSMFQMNFVRSFFYSLCIFYCTHLQAQIDTNSVISESEVVITGYSLKESPASVDSIQPLLHQPGFSLVSGLNTLPGVRMEERSPGSYRLSIRGSLLRSPFGVRNVKIYLDDFPLTDAGGNTYLNALDPGSISSIEIWRGPYGSLYGANTGGVVRIRSYEQHDTTGGQFSIGGGAYGMFHEKAGVQKRWKNQYLKIYQAYQRSDGYRDNSALKRQFYQASYYNDYHKGMRFRALAFYSDLNYETPGGLTQLQYDQNPKAARMNAQQQHAAIGNKMVYGGIGHDAQLSKHLKHVISVFVTANNFKNPFLTNYEVRNERTYGVRTYLEANGTKGHKFLWKANIGAEWQKTQSGITNYGNRNGIKDTIQSDDDIHARQYVVFTQFSANIGTRLLTEAGISLNNYHYDYRSILFGNDWSHKTFDPQFMPRIACSYTLKPSLLWRASVSRGYSAPSIAEVRPSNSIIYTGLQAEYGWNYETGLRFHNKRLRADAAVFYYALQRAIVSRTDSNGMQTFVNSGGTKQPGLETQLTYILLQNRNYGFVRMIELKNSITWYTFSFSDYRIDGSDYSGHRLTGVPRTVVIGSLFVGLTKGFTLYVQYNHTSMIPLNDANTVYANAYHLLQSKIGWNKKIAGNHSIELYAGGDNLLNQQYSLGNDLNAFGGRYFNAAPVRNYYGGMAYRF